MIRSRSLLVALASIALLAGCGGNKPASQSDVKDEVHDQLVEVGYVAPGTDPADAVPVSDDDANAVATCVADFIFENFEEDDRNDVTSTDGEQPRADLVARVEVVLQDCVDSEIGATVVGPEAPRSSTSTTGADDGG